MNRLCYRVIFSKTLNKLIVVSEKTSAQAKSGSRPSPNIHIQKNQSAFLSLSSIKPTSLYLAILLGFVSHTTYANIIADPTAPNTHKPIIVAGTNTQGQKVPVVQIRTPVNGVSHNKYSQFDVAQVGVVLNNSRAGTPTHLAGMIGANPFLQQGEAHTLINEINSSKISQLSGNIEIAGQKANLIIANPLL